MPTQKQVIESLDTIPVPGVMRSLVKMNLVREVRVADHKVDVTLASAALAPEAQQWLKDRIVDTATKLEGVEEASVSFVDGKPKDINEIKHIIAVMSGKGGVGKSLVASLAAIALKRQGYEVGILDADITGASIPKMFGINARPSGSDSGILPVSS
ncbi:MAG: P-loop NTPase, partial [Dehalococcoidia bacterium]|nr:P-loop NTPase [Dehalococcoidia bacterium]